MGTTTGITPMGVYAGSATAGAAIDKLLALIPDPDNRTTRGPMAGGNPTSPVSMLDEMSMIAAVQLRVELLALKAVVDTFEAP